MTSYAFETNKPKHDSTCPHKAHASTNNNDSTHLRQHNQKNITHKQNILDKDIRTIDKCCIPSFSKPHSIHC